MKKKQVKLKKRKSEPEMSLSLGSAFKISNRSLCHDLGASWLVV